MSLGNKLTWYLLIGVLAVTGLDTYLSFTRTRANLIEDLRAEVAAISRTLRVTLEMSGDDTPERYFDQLSGSISGFENILGLVFYNRAGQVAATSASLHGGQLPAVDARTVITTRTPVEGLFEEDSLQHYYRLEPILDSTGEGIAAFLIIENLPFLTQEVRSRALQTLLTTLVLMTVLAVIVSLVIRRSVTLPLRTFAHRIEAIGQGYLDQRLHMTRKDEIGKLAQEFDRMCAQLETAQHKLVAESEEKLRLERALRHSEKLAALGQLASRLAHEIGTPLNVIHGRAEQLLQRNTLSERDRAFLGIIVAQIERISGFIRQLLTLARRPEPQRCVVQPNEIVRRVWEVIGERGHTPEVQVTMTLAPDLPPIWGNPDQLQQVILNLSVNALQAVDSMGEVSLSTRLQPNGSPQSGRMVEIVVADTGPGIPPDNIPHLFEPFFTTKDALGGSGLGLAISHEIVLTHQGEIRVESELGQGTRFIVALPQLRSQTTPQTAETSRVPISVS
jgi:two-component system NtrC family sensor kinase